MGVASLAGGTIRGQACETRESHHQGVLA